MKNLSYKHLFNGIVSHEDALKERIKSLLVEILRDVKNVSEKSFRQYDELISVVNNFFTEEVFKECEILYNNNKRLQFISEIIYDKYIKDDILDESVVAKFSSF